MKKVLVFILAAVLCLSITLAGCQSSNSPSGGDKTANNTEKPVENDKTEDDTSAESNLTEKGMYPIVNEKVDMSVMIATEAEDVENSYVTKFYEEKTNIHINWQVIPRDGGAEKISLMLASKQNLPEVIISGYSGAISQDVAYSYGQQGMFLALNKLIDENCVNLQKAFNYAPDFRRQMTSPDGEIYGFAEWNECFHCMYHQRAYINTTWLKNLGLEKPKTTDDLIKVLEAFMDQDANVYGDPGDEIPLTSVHGWGGGVDGFLSNPFIYDDGENRLYIKDGKVDATFVQPEFKEALSFIKKLYDDKLLDSEAFNTDTATAKMLAGAEEGNRLGLVLTGGPAFVDYTTNRQLEYEALEPLTGPTGLKQTGFYPTSASAPKAVITNECKDPVMAVRWIDGMYDEEDLRWMGELGVHVREGKPGDVSFTGEQAAYLDLPATEEQMRTKDWRWAQPYIRTHAFRHSMGYDPSIYNDQKVLYDNAVLYDGLEPKDRTPIPYLYFDTDQMLELSEIRTNVNSYVAENIAAFVVGQRSLENDWDNYTKEFDNMGLQTYLGIIQKAYDEQVKK
jgi:putative aldouronate transport system substrate-binding protein